jgi:choline-sulfatase
VSKKVAWLLPVIAGFLASCSPSPKPDSLVVVIIDTCRADHVGAKRGENEVTPFLDAFADQAASFTHAYSHSPWTLPSLASLFTSKIPMHHGAGGRLGEFRSLPQEAVTLAEVCREAGLRTAAVSNVQFLSPKYGTTQGFDHVDFIEAESNTDARRATGTTDAALSWLAQNGDQPFLLVVHYFDPHLVYDPPEPYRSRFAADGAGGKVNRDFGKLSQIQQMRKGNLKLSPADYVWLGGLYDGEISYTDAEFGRFLQGLEETGTASRAVVTVVSDHGEEFNDHGSFEHGHTLYDELLHVPLLIRAPGTATDAARISGIVALKDVAPTLCELIDVPVSAEFTGRSLVPALSGGSLPPRPILSQGNMWGPEQAALRMGNWKVIVETIPGEQEETVAKRFKLFDLSEDPGEQKNIAEDHPERLAAMIEHLDKLLSEGKTEGQAPELSEKERERLRSLGYVR